MPEISRFFGIIITLYYNDHAPAHFHIRYSGQKAVMTIEGFEIIEGSLSPRVRALVLEWAGLHHQELREDWNLAMQRAPLNSIAPLE
jgi:hypothetical protein